MYNFFGFTYTAIIATESEQSLTIGPISVKDLDYRYRMVARDSNGMCVHTIIRVNKNHVFFKKIKKIGFF